MNREKSIELMNKAVADELLAIEQYLYFHFICEDRGYDPLSAIFKRVSIVEMTHLEMLAERILFLGGDVVLKTCGPVEQIRDVRKMLERAMELEESSVDAYNEWAKLCAENEDSATKALFEKLVGIEEQHLDTFETEMKNMEKFGDNYLALQAISRSQKEGGKEGSE